MTAVVLMEVKGFIGSSSSFGQKKGVCKELHTPDYDEMVPS
jgi:hypothetical protein